MVVAVVDREPTAAEVRDNRLDFLINRPIAAEAARAVLAKASEDVYKRQTCWRPRACACRKRSKRRGREDFGSG